MKYKTKRGLARIIAKKYSTGFECAVMQDEKGLYLMGFARMSFPSSNADEVLARVRVTDEAKILAQLENYDVPEKGTIRETV